MDLKIRRMESTYIIDAQGDMDLYNSTELRKVFMKMLEKKVERLILNFEAVEYIDSSGIGTLIFICSTSKRANMKLAIAQVHGAVKKAMQLTKLLGYFPITEDLTSALDMVRD
ncbi:MAG: STAS domain-containing protein [Spirochaetaceae bacterium]|jgi:anti-sigma B factor antagonist|nr:STAS domain-containing protein [Spirochaetaceae bacterium]